jgi:predicted MFS family arabinose efflux permease
MTIPNLWISVILAFTVNLSFGLLFTAANNLILDLVPHFRGTIMSLLTAAESLGLTFGTSVGGLILVYYAYNILGLVIGSLGVIAALLVYFGTK